MSNANTVSVLPANLLDGDCVPGEHLAVQTACVVEAKPGIFKVYYRGLYTTVGFYQTGIMPSRDLSFARAAAERLQAERRAAKVATFDYGSDPATAAPPAPMW